MVIVSTFGPALAAYLVYLYRQGQERLKKEHWYAMAAEFARTAVLAAEQLGLTKQIEEYACSKYDYAIGYVKMMLAKNGIKADLDIPLNALEMMIEAEVLLLPTPLLPTS
jgi:hypothetical protein